MVFVAYLFSVQFRHGHGLDMDMDMDMDMHEPRGAHTMNSQRTMRQTLELDGVVGRVYQ